MKQCCNPRLGLATKLMACKGVGRDRSLRVTFHAPKSVGGCEGMNPHTPKCAPILGVGVSNFQKTIAGSKLIGLKSSLYHLKYLGL